ncbi:MAG: TIGR00159 family protein [Caldilineaceae bacterium]|nr:diadenylate cyclase CdaA [Caldilineaceae bacterium]MCB9138723.1 TIGR00159 family protein [Caldilineaceae bacterium]
MTEILESLSRLNQLQNLLDVLLVSVLIYFVLLIFRGTQAIQLMRGLLVIGIVLLILASTVELTAFNWLLRVSAPVFLFAIPVIFQPELRRALERVGRTAPLAMRRTESASRQQLVSEVVRAVEQMAERKHGALIVFEGSTGLTDIIERGVAIDGDVSTELLTTIFHPNTSLHDGAVIVQGDKIAAAGCVLPLTQRELKDTQLGTRHRAAIGVTEQSDAMSVVVSEETGTISVARNGRILRLDSNRLRKLLTDYYNA